MKKKKKVGGGIGRGSWGGVDRWRRRETGGRGVCEEKRGGACGDSQNGILIRAGISLTHDRPEKRFYNQWNVKNKTWNNYSFMQDCSI